MGLGRKDGRVCVLLAVLQALWVARALASDVTLVADAHVSSARPTVNSGALSNLNVGGGYTVLMQFDLGLLPAGTAAAQVSRAVLRLYVNRVDTAGPVSLQPINSGWSEATVTFQTIPALGSTVQALMVAQEGAYVAIDVTALVQGWLTAPATNFGVALTSDAAVVQFDSKENDQTAHPADLSVEIATPGPAGVNGRDGATGPVGPVGPAGAQGPPGLTGSTAFFVYRGAFDPTAIYALNDTVVSAGSSYVSLFAGNRGNTPAADPLAWGLLAQGASDVAGSALAYDGAYDEARTYGPNEIVTFLGSSFLSLRSANLGNIPGTSAAFWGLLAQQGAAGVAGVAGPAGATGPQGVQGQAGPAGAPGPVGVTYHGAWLVGTFYQVRDAVLFGGTSYYATTSSTGLEPDLYPAAWAVLAQGGTGIAGPTGAAATVAVGTVTTGAPGTPAMVTNRGTSTAAVLDFVVPQGVPGTGGGGSGTAQTLSGIPFLSTYHAVSFASLYYSVNGAGSSFAETPDVLTWVPGACTVSRLVVFSQQQNALAVTLRIGPSAAAMTDSGIACSVSQGSSCMATGQAFVPAGNFVDLRVTGASGLAAPMWTAAECD